MSSLPQINSADVQSRQQYLRSQRDKIIAAKKKVRAHQLSETVRKTTTAGRPGSAQAAQTILNMGTTVRRSGAADGDDNGGRQMEASMELRRTLARRLRTEVVNGDPDDVTV